MGSRAYDVPYTSSIPLSTPSFFPNLIYVVGLGFIYELVSHPVYIHQNAVAYLSLATGQGYVYEATSVHESLAGAALWLLLLLLLLNLYRSQSVL